MIGSVEQGNRNMVNVAKDFGRHLIGRDIGSEIRKQHFSGPPESWPHGLDLTRVEQATESCVDELLGTLARDYGLQAVKALRIEGASSPVSETIDYVLTIASEPPSSLSAEMIEGLLVPEKHRPRTARTPRRPRKKR